MNKKECVNKLRKFVLSLLITYVMVILMGCQSQKPENKSGDIVFKDNTIVYTKWNEIFEDDTVIPLTFNDPSLEIFTIGEISTMPDGGYIIADGKWKKCFNSTMLVFLFVFLLVWATAQDSSQWALGDHLLTRLIIYIYRISSPLESISTLHLITILKNF